MPVYVIATDSFMSGWGMAPGRSLVAAQCQTVEEADLVAEKFRARPEFKRVRTARFLPWLRKGDHMAIWSAASHPQWFKP